MPISLVLPATCLEFSHAEFIGKDELNIIIDSLGKSKEHYKNRLKLMPEDIYLLEKIAKIDRFLDTFNDEYRLIDCL